MISINDIDIISQKVKNCEAFFMSSMIEIKFTFVLQSIDNDCQSVLSVGVSYHCINNSYIALTVNIHDTICASSIY